MTETDSSLPRGAVTPASPVTVDDFDRAHAEAARSDLFWQVCLWLVRALNVSLVAVNWSAAGVRAASI